MTISQVRKIAIVHELLCEVIETHISLILLTKQYVYKIKKPVRFSFLDFSMLAQRKYYCGEELKLNNRLTDEIYLDVVPVTQVQDTFFIGKNEGKIIDYAVKMKRIKASKQMHLLLEKNQVTRNDIEKIANKLVPFHQAAKVISRPLNLVEMKENFNDIRSVKYFVKKEIGEEYEKIINACIQFSDRFLEDNNKFLTSRIDKGMIRDGHGDLHSSNIFLDEEPIIFDCLEFNAKFREIDILNELAFFCLDLEAYDHEDLSVFFMKKYRQFFPEIIQTDFETQLFLYYKLYRANIRAKVISIKAKQIKVGEEKEKLFQEITTYLHLMEKYFLLLTKRMSMKNFFLRY